MLELDPAVQAFVDATNAEDSDAFLAAFAEDAVLVDWGREFAGRAAIARWNSGENIGVHSRIDVLGATREGDTTTIEIEVSGDGYNGGGSFVIRTADGLIQHLSISG